ncbi:MAG: winged helix-turn-helix transcriptional regulator [Methanoregula sp.]|jgi:predicted transcriptional regulator
MDIDRLAIVISAVCLVFLFFVVPMSGILNHGGYVVVPASEGDPTSPYTDTSGADRSVTFWELPPWVMLEYAACCVSPLLVYPLELLFVVKVFGCLGYRKITSATVFRNDTRTRVYETIAANPGIYFNEISRISGISRGTLRYHLGVLQVTGKIAVMKSGSDVRYFENSGKFSDADQKILAFLQNGKDRIICEYLIHNPASTRGDLEKVLGITGAAVTWRMNRLRDAGVLTVVKTGRLVRYTVNPDAIKACAKYLPDEPGPAGDVPK